MLTRIQKYIKIGGHMKCDECKWWNNHTSAFLGECRRHPPVRKGMTNINTYDAEGVWPLVKHSEWCGEFSEHETKETKMKIKETLV